MPSSRLNQALASGAATLAFDESRGGYLGAVLDALQVPVSSQMLAFAETSLQASQIRRDNPRAVYYNDVVSVAWIRGSDLLELAAQDPQQGVVLLHAGARRAGASPRFARNDTVPGVPSVVGHAGRARLRPADGVPPHQRSRVRGRRLRRSPPAGRGAVGRVVRDRPAGAGAAHGQPADDAAEATDGPRAEAATVQGEIDAKGYLTPHSDVAALLVFDHQVHAANLLTRLNWEARAGTSASVDEAATDLADYLLFVDEAPIPGKVEGSSGFAEAFAARGPRDAKGRSLRDLKLEGRLMQYPAQLHDLHAGLRRLAGDGSHRGRRPPVRRAVGQGHAAEIRAPDAGAADRDSGDSEDDQAGRRGVTHDGA